jgi:hypothetical protein
MGNLLEKQKHWKAEKETAGLKLTLSRRSNAHFPLYANAAHREMQEL